uniref:Uncharacterized protein n=1 Tax=Lepeophtheirus salmonis TaxID=72036 RepID=A0A0K2T7Q0_LEPSM
MRCNKSDKQPHNPCLAFVLTVLNKIYTMISNIIS